MSFKASAPIANGRHHNDGPARGKGCGAAIEKRRLSYVESQMHNSGISRDVARARAQILYWGLSWLCPFGPCAAGGPAFLKEMLRMASP